MAQIINITSEALQATIRRLLPSQQGFGEDLQASNIITPIIDLTPTAEGSLLEVSLQQALSFGSQTSFGVAGSSAVIANTAGFYRIFGVSVVDGDTSTARLNSFSMSDGLSSKDIWIHRANASGAATLTAIQFDFNVFLASGESISVTSNNSDSTINGSTRQIADVNGNLIVPSGYVSQ